MKKTLIFLATLFIAVNIYALTPTATPTPFMTATKTVPTPTATRTATPIPQKTIEAYRYYLTGVKAFGLPKNFKAINPKKVEYTDSEIVEYIVAIPTKTAVSLTATAGIIATVNMAKTIVAGEGEVIP